MTLAFAWAASARPGLSSTPMIRLNGNSLATSSGRPLPQPMSMNVAASRSGMSFSSRRMMAGLELM